MMNTFGQAFCDLQRHRLQGMGAEIITFVPQLGRHFTYTVTGSHYQEADIIHSSAVHGFQEVSQT
ncbi:hypothetical protein D3C87_1843280 [compost metagenome]